MDSRTCLSRGQRDCERDTTPVVDLGRTYDVAPDGRYLVVKGAATDPAAGPPSLIVVQHWGEELKRLVPTR